MDTRIYVQLRPDEAGIRRLQATQGELKPGKTGRMMPEEELHMTVIHFGKTADVKAALQAVTALDDATYESALNDYTARTRALLTGERYELHWTGYGHFGAHGKTLVATFEAPEPLHALHREAFEALRRFVSRCGVKDPDAFIRNDPNFTHAQVLRPHITLYKGYEGPDPDVPLGDITVHFMKLVY